MFFFLFLPCYSYCRTFANAALLSPLKVMRVAAKARSVAATSMNAQSSRSHTVFTLRLQCTQSVPNGKGGVNKTVRTKKRDWRCTFVYISL